MKQEKKENKFQFTFTQKKLLTLKNNNRREQYVDIWRAIFSIFFFFITLRSNYIESCRALFSHVAFVYLSFEMLREREKKRECIKLKKKKNFLSYLCEAQTYTDPKQRFASYLISRTRRWCDPCDQSSLPARRKL